MTRTALLLLLAGCGSPAIAPSDAGADVVYGHKTFDASIDVAEAAPPKVEDDRLQAHGGAVLAAPHVAAIYVDYGGNADAFLTWVLGSTEYWSVLAQYGVGYGTFVGSIAIPTATLFQDGDIAGSVVDSWVLDERLDAAIHAPGSTVPAADAYIVYLGWLQVNVDGSKTCGEIMGYHSVAGGTPYSLIPPCGHSFAASHELAEMATDPYPFQGWYSEADQVPAGGEVGDLCADTVKINGYVLNALWSNKDGDCEPAF